MTLLGSNRCSLQNTSSWFPEPTYSLLQFHRKQMREKTSYRAKGRKKSGHVGALSVVTARNDKPWPGVGGSQMNSPFTTLHRGVKIWKVPLPHWKNSWDTWSGRWLAFSGETGTVEPKRKELGDGGFELKLLNHLDLPGGWISPACVLCWLHCSLCFYSKPL